MSPTTPVPPPSGPAATSRPRSPLRTVIIVLCAIVAFLVLAVGAVVAYAMLRPVGGPDYRTASSDLTAVDEALVPLITRQTQMMDLTLLPTPEQIQKAADAQREQLATFRSELTEWGKSRAVRDEELRTRYTAVVTSTDTRLAPMVNDFVDHYSAVLLMSQLCSEYDKSVPVRPGRDTSLAWFEKQIQQCEQATKAAAASTVFTPFVEIRQKHIAASRSGYQEYEKAGDDDARLVAMTKILVAQNGMGTRTSEGLQAVTKANEQIFAEVTGGLEGLRAYCEEHG